MENGVLGCSADGLVYEASSGEQGVLEIKCPFSAADAPLLEVAAKSSHFCAKPTANGELVLKKSHAYYYQIQGNMAILGLKWCDFVLWSPADIFVERIAFDKKLWFDMERKLMHFFCHWLLPELLLKKGREGKDIEEVLY